MPSTELRLSFRATAAAIACLIVIALAFRIASPSDIDTRDQARTIAYTVDMVYNGNILLAADTAGLPATKPPLINYLSAPLVYAFGPTEWAFRLPSLFAFAGILVLTFMTARFLFLGTPAQPSLLGLTQSEWAVLLSVAFYGLSNGPLRVAYLSRPDALLVFGMMLSWYAATRALAAREEPGARWAVAFWLGAMIAAWAKGPLALIPILYAVLAARLLHDSWRRVRRLWPVAGFAATLIVGLAWPAAVYLTDPGHFTDVLLGDELAGQFSSRWYSQLVMIVLVPAYMISRFLPWSLAGIAGALVFPWRQWRNHALAPALLYLGLLMIALMATTSIRGDRLAPFFPPLAIVCAWGAVYHPMGDRLLRVAIASVPAACVALCLYFTVLSDQSQERYGQNVVDFVARAKEFTRGERVLFCRMEHQLIPVEPLFGINQRGVYPDRAPPGGAWVVEPSRRDRQAVLTSGPAYGHTVDLFRAPPNAEICRGRRN